MNSLLQPVVNLLNIKRDRISLIVHSLTREGTIGNISEDVKLRGIGITDYNYSNPIAYSVEFLPTISNGLCKVFTFREDIPIYTYAFFSVAKDISWDIFVLQVGRISSNRLTELSTSISLSRMAPRQSLWVTGNHPRRRC